VELIVLPSTTVVKDKNNDIKTNIKGENMKRVLSLSLISLLWGCSPSHTDKLILTGSSTIAPLAVELAYAFEQLHPEVEIDVQMGGSSRGINDVRLGLSDIGMASRELKPEEQDLQAHTVAYDGITIILNSENPVTKITDEQVIAIYTNQINNWSALGGPDQPITVVNKAEGHSTLELFLHYFKIKNTQVIPDAVIGDNQQGIKTVVGNPWAIAYVSIGTAEYESQHKQPIKLLSLGGIEASTATVKTGVFPLSRPLNFVTASTPSGWAKEFIDFSQSVQAHSLIINQYFIPNDAQ